MRPFICFLFLLSACAPSPAPAQAARFPAGRCINMANALNAPNEGDWTYRIEQSHIEMVAQAGFDSIRVPIAWSAHAAHVAPYSIEPEFFTRIDQVISQAFDNDLMFILDVHNFEALNENPARETPRMRAIWQQIAWHYANAPDGLVFELLNEPMGKMKGRRWEKLMRQLIADIRQTNPDRWLIVGGDNWNSLDGLARLDAPYDRRLVLTYHDYEPYEFTHQGASWFKNPPPVGTSWGTAKEQAELRARAARAARIRDKTGMPVWLGEFGSHQKAPAASRVRWTKAMRHALAAEDIGWCAFDFAAEFSFWSPATQSWNRDLLDALLGDQMELRQ
ncbi:MAG: glycoside hydrolase [Robiginitomaculum sp.]|nr:MAG: glycoside hydrolase [Robiginitomaculum sp.]